MSDGHIPMATIQIWTGVFGKFWFNWQQPPNFCSGLSSHLPAEHLPTLSLAATFLGYTANDPKEKKKKCWEKGKDKSSGWLTSVQKSQCERQHAKWIPTWYMESGLMMTELTWTKVRVDVTVQSPNGDKCQCNTFIVWSADSLHAADDTEWTHAVSRYSMSVSEGKTTSYIKLCDPCVNRHSCLLSLDSRRQYQNSRLHDALKIFQCQWERCHPVGHSVCRNRFALMSSDKNPRSKTNNYTLKKHRSCSKIIRDQ